MSFAPRTAARTVKSCSRITCRSSSTSSASTSTPPPLKASLVLSRQPLLTKTLHPVEETYYAHNLNIRHALSNPISEEFYFKEGSLPHRRWRRSEWEYLKKTYGEDIAGPEPDKGADIPPERPVEEFARDHWVKEDAKRGEKSLERYPEEEVFCLVQRKDGGAWGFPEVGLEKGETLHGVVESKITGEKGWFGGKTMDTWLVTKKPVEHSKEGEERTFYLRSHILAGEPKLSSDSPWKSHAWLNRAEVEERLRKQGKGQWEKVQRLFGVKPEQKEVGSL